MLGDIIPKTQMAIYLGLIVIFLGVFFIHIIFNTYIGVSKSFSSTALDSVMFFTLCFVIIVGFIVTIELTIYMMFKGVEDDLKISFFEKIGKGKVYKDLESRKKQLLDAKKMVGNKYYKREIDEETYRKLTQKYNGQLVEIESKLKGMEKKFYEGTGLV